MHINQSLTARANVGRPFRADLRSDSHGARVRGQDRSALGKYVMEAPFRPAGKEFLQREAKIAPSSVKESGLGTSFDGSMPHSSHKTPKPSLAPDAVPSFVRWMQFVLRSLPFWLVTDFPAIVILYPCADS
jgi:hypothetical protein